MSWVARPLMELRPYQREAIDAVLDAWERERSVLLVLPTGTGKTFTAGEILRPRAKRGRILWLAHRGELLTQAIKTVQGRIGLGCELEKAEQRASVDGTLWGAEPVVVASVPTLKGPRLKRWPRDAFTTIVVDEAHHAAARTYRAILRHFDQAQVLGLTATPDRSDGVAMGHVFDCCAYEYAIRDAIAEGFLVPIVQKRIVCADLDISDVKTTTGDLAQGELEERLRVDAVLHQIAGPLVKEAGDRSTIVFCAGVQQAKALVDVLAAYMPAELVAEINGNTPEELRAERFKRFARGDLRVLVNVGVATEGTDLPIASCIAVARPTKSRSLYTQMIGRGLRLAEGKTDCLVLDFVGNSGQHRLVTPADVLAGGPLPEDVAQRVADLTLDGKPTAEALAQAEAEQIERERRDEEKRKREEARLRAKVAYQAQVVDAFGLGIGSGSGPRATERQREVLRRMGLDANLSRQEASRFLDEAKRRRTEGLCTYRQARVLAKAGLHGDVSFEIAGRAITALKANGWKPTSAMRDWFAAVRQEAAE